MTEYSNLDPQEAGLRIARLERRIKELEQECLHRKLATELNGCTIEVWKHRAEKAEKALQAVQLTALRWLREPEPQRILSSIQTFRRSASDAVTDLEALLRDKFNG